ncbi:TetR/AcrR family transcriptional regulator [Kocuria rhizophila]|uniref:TetR/AcrR family transcriptional regulator n=1 Tax=Kocuria rhizophila TaxID=72000 RepID=UPI0025B0C2B7|nr:TetR/AcrR family transcriptional regulator [Kocuria rhizophila]MDN3226612.1 TetR/AcrR family transcriptional regulator [Kocuria rhizophila]
MTHPQPSLRERHRARTLTEIHQAALELAASGSFSDTTVDAIAENAGISRRTFFNYYASKEDAVLGITPPQISECAHARYMDRSTGDEFARTVRLFMDVLRESTGPPEFVSRRRELVEQYPELKRRIGIHVNAAENLVVSTVAEQAGQGAMPRSEETTHAYVLLAGSVIKFAFRTDTHLATVSDDAAVQHALDHAIGVFRTAFKEIA